MSASHDAPESQFSAGLARSYRRLTIASITSSIVLLFCAGFCLLTTKLFGPTWYQGEEGANKVAGRIVEFTPPQGFKGKLGMEIDFRVFRFDVAKFVQDNGRGNLVVAQMSSQPFAAATDRNQIKQTVENMSPELKTLKVDHSRKKAMTIRSLPAEFQIQTGEDVASTTRLLEVTGTFRGKSDDAFLVLQCEEGILSDQEIEQFLQSIR
jgi:hypothetical protein